jgi:hypothetical protein
MSGRFDGERAKAKKRRQARWLRTLPAPRMLVNANVVDVADGEG